MASSTARRAASTVEKLPRARFRRFALLPLLVVVLLLLVPRPSPDGQGAAAVAELAELLPAQTITCAFQDRVGGSHATPDRGVTTGRGGAPGMGAGRGDG